MACPVNTGQALVPTPVNLGITQQQTHSMAGMSEGLSVIEVGAGGSAENCANGSAAQSGSAAASPSASPEELLFRVHLAQKIFKNLTSTPSQSQPPRDQTPAKTRAHQSLASLVVPHLLDLSPSRKKRPTLSPEESRLRKKESSRKWYIRNKEERAKKLLTLSAEEIRVRNLRQREVQREYRRRKKHSTM